MGMSSNRIDMMVQVGAAPTAFGVMSEVMAERRVLFEFYSPHTNTR